MTMRELRLHRKVAFLDFAEKVLYSVPLTDITRNGEIDKIALCVLFIRFAPAKANSNDIVEKKFPELYQEIKKAKKTTNSSDFGYIHWKSEAYAIVGRLRLLGRVRGQLV